MTIETHFMFIDASAIIAILAAAPDAEIYVTKIEAAPKRHYSAIVAFEATISLARILADLDGHKELPIPRGLIDLAQEKVEAFLAVIDAVPIAISGAAHMAALEAAKTYGKFVAHPARLNFGDCFAYACATSHHLPLLFKGDDFTQTDIRRA